MNKMNNLSQEVKILCCEYGNMEIVKKSSHTMIAYVSNLKQRPLSISNDHVESFSRYNLKKVADELKKPTCHLKALLQFHNDEQIPMQKMFEILNIQSVTRKGVSSLKLEFGLLESKGAYAAAATNFANLNDGDYYQDVFILCWPYDLGLC
jgi:hypothetical protein